MNHSIVEVIPVVKGIAKPTLSYFVGGKVGVGDLVRVPIRGTKALGIISSVESVKSAKTNIKSSSFSLKKIPVEDIMDRSVPPLFMNAVKEAALYYATPVGSVLGTLLPKFMLENPELFSEERARILKTSPSLLREEPLVIQMETPERLSQYKNVIRESLAKKKSVMFVAPTHEEAQKAFEYLSKGISDYTHLFSLGQKLKDLKKSAKEARESEHPILFITTPAGIAFHRSDFGTIIIERENSRAYRSITRPFINTRTFLALLSQAAKKRLILGDTVLSLETLWRERKGEYKELFPITWRLTASSHNSLVDMKTIGESNDNAKQFEIFSPELRALIQRALDEDRGIFLFGARKGLAPTTVCGDCGTVLPCKNCRAPVVLHQSKKFPDGRMYICHSCGAERPAHTVCSHCKSWKLIPLGIGTDRIEEDLGKHFPKVPVHILDKDHAPTDAKARAIAKNFKEKGGILVGTELAFFHLDTVPYAGVVSLDSLFSIPDFSINERIFYLLNRIIEMTERRTIIQTRNIGKHILAWAAAGNVLDYYRGEIAEREELFYPPFSMFIRVVLPQKFDEKSLAKLKQHLAKWDPILVRGSLVMRLDREKWPDPELAGALALLTPDFLIKVDPESII